MVRKSCFILGIALGIFWWVGLSENQGAAVLWFDAVAAVLAFGTAALVSDPERNPSRLAGPVDPRPGAGHPLGRRHVDRATRLGQLAELRVRGRLPGGGGRGGAAADGWPTPRAETRMR